MKTTLRVIMSVLVVLAGLAVMALGMIAVVCALSVAEHAADWVHLHPWVMVLAGLITIAWMVVVLDEATK